MTTVELFNIIIERGRGIKRHPLDRLYELEQEVELICRHANPSVDIGKTVRVKMISDWRGIAQGSKTQFKIHISEAYWDMIPLDLFDLPQ